MDFSPLLQQTMSTLWYLPFIAVLLIIIKSSWFKGKAGELIVNLFTMLMLNKKQYHLIKNVTLPTLDGTTQVDHIIVSVYGVFVVETKHMKGWIFGSARQKIWTQKIYKHSSKFQNPLHQNYKHLKTLEKLLALDEAQLHSLVVFIGDCQLKTKMPENITKGLGYVRFVKSKKEKVLSENDVIRVVNEIKKTRLTPSLRTDRQHIKHVREIVGD